MSRVVSLKHIVLVTMLLAVSLVLPTVGGIDAQIVNHPVHHVWRFPTVTDGRVNETQYIALNTIVFPRISETSDKNYLSALANAFIQQAIASYSQSILFAEQRDWDHAYEAPQHTQNFIEQAEREERYKLGLAIGGMVVAALAMVFIVLQTTTSSR